MNELIAEQLETIKRRSEREVNRPARNNTLYQIYDLKADSIAGPIMIEKRDGPAIRTFYDLLANPQTGYSKHPDDFELRVLGIQDEDTGKITGCLPYMIATGTAWLESQKPREQQLSVLDSQTNGSPDLKRFAER